MRYITQKLFTKKAVVLTLLLCLLPQLVCLALRYINEYYIAEDILLEHYGEFFDIACTVIGTVSTFASYGIMTYIVFVGGIKGGGEWLFGLVSAILLGYFLIYLTESAGFGIAVGIILSVFAFLVLVLRTKNIRSVSVIIALSLLSTYVAATLILFATTLVTSSDVAESAVFGLINYSVDMAMVCVAAQVAKLFRAKAEEKNENISVGSAVLPKGRPILKSVLVTDILFTALSLVGKLAETVQDLKEYGSAKNASELIYFIRPYLSVPVLFVLGYFVALFAVRILENGYFEASDTDARLNRPPEPKAERKRIEVRK